MGGRLRASGGRRDREREGERGRACISLSVETFTSFVSLCVSIGRSPLPSLPNYHTHYLHLFRIKREREVVHIFHNQLNLPLFPFFAFVDRPLTCPVPAYLIHILPPPVPHWVFPCGLFVSLFGEGQLIPAWIWDFDEWGVSVFSQGISTREPAQFNTWRIAGKQGQCGAVRIGTRFVLPADAALRWVTFACPFLWANLTFSFALT